MIPRRQFLRTLGLATAALGLAACDRAGPTPAARPLTYTAIGASDTVGVGAASPDTESWPAVLQRRLPPGSKLVNLGVSGTLLKQAIDQQLPVALDADPDLVTVWLAVNDYAARVPLDRYAAELDTLLAELRAGTHAAILVGNVPDLSVLPSAARFDLRDIDRWNVVIGEVIARHDATPVDLHATYGEIASHPEYISSDGFHPSTAGYERLAALFYESAAPKLGLP